MADKTGVARLRQAIENQWDAGEACFSLPFDEASVLLRECEDELARLAWADGVPAPVDADGTVVPLDTKVMYTHMGKKIELSEFDLFHSVLSGGFVWRAIRNTGHGVNDLRLSCLHLRRPDIWEKLEEDVEQYKKNGTACAFYGRTVGDCSSCLGVVARYCDTSVASDILRRAKALAERGAKEADRD